MEAGEYLIEPHPTNRQFGDPHKEQWYRKPLKVVENLMLLLISLNNITIKDPLKLLSIHMPHLRIEIRSHDYSRYIKDHNGYVVRVPA